MRRLNKFNKKAFTLVELVIVIAVIAILSVVLIPQLTGVINDAKIARDKAAASQMTLTLQTSFPEGLTENIEATDIRSILNESGTTYSFIPNSGNNGSFWYDMESNSIVFGTGSQIAEGIALAEEESPVVLNSIEELIPGYLLLDTANSNLGKVVSSIRNLQNAQQFESVKEKIDSLTIENTGLTAVQLASVVSHLKNDFKPANTLFVNDFDYFTTSSDICVKNIVFADGITYLPEYLGQVMAIENGIVLPNSLKFISKNTLLNKIEQVEFNSNTIDTNIVILNNNMITTGNADIFSAYVLSKNAAFAQLSANARAKEIANVDFSAVVNSKNLKTNADGSKKMPISIEANIPSYYDANVCLPSEKCYSNILNTETLLTKSEYEALAENDKENYTARTIDRTKILTMRFKYETLDTGYIKVTVMVLDTNGLLCQGETTYYPEVEMNSLDFSNGSVLFTNPKIPSFDAEDIGYKIELLNAEGEVIENATFEFTAQDINSSNVMVEYGLGLTIGNLDFMQQLVDTYQYTWYAENDTVLGNATPDTTCYIKKIVTTPSVDGDTTTTKTSVSKIFINDENKLYEDYYKSTFIVKEVREGNTISVDCTEEHLRYQRSLTAISLPTNYLTSVLSENGIRYNTLNTRVSVYKNEVLLASRTSSFGTAENPISTSYVRDITDESEMAFYYYDYEFMDPLYYTTTTSTEQLAFTDKNIYNYSKLSNNSYSFKIKGTGEFDGEGIQLAILNGVSVASKRGYNAQYYVEYDVQPNYVAVSIKGLDSLYSLITAENIPNSIAYTNRLTYVYASERELVNTNQTYTLETFNGRSVAKKTDTENTYTFTLTAGEDFNPLNTKIKFADNTVVNASAFAYDVETVGCDKVVTINIGDSTLIVECEVTEINLTIAFANPGIASSINVTPAGETQQTITNLQSGQNLTCLFDQVFSLEANTPAEGYRFVGWFENGNLLSVLKNYDYITGDKSSTIVAEYATDPANLLVFTVFSNKTARLDWCYNKNITEVYIPSHYDDYKVIEIEDEVFNNCVFLETIVVPSTVTLIGTDAFNNTLFLTNLASEGLICFGYYLYKYIEPIADPPTTVTVPEGITIIMDYAFQNCTSIETIVLPSTLTTIGSYAFDCCKNLKNIIIPDSVTTIKSYAFRECISLEEIDINNVATLGSAAFINCVSLETFIMSDNIKVLSDSTFNNCVMLTNITLHEGITTLGKSLFANCSALVTITIPSTVVSINVSSLFSGCTALAEVIFAEDNTYRQLGASFFANCQVLTEIRNLNISNLLLISSSAFSGCSSFDFGDLVLGTGALEEEITLSSSAFANCYLLKSVTFESPLKGSIIPTTIFSGCTALTQVNFISGINTINDSAFYNCISLTKLNGISFGAVNFIGNSAFAYCSNMNFGDTLTIGSMSAKKVSIGNQAFYNCYKLKNVIIRNENLYNAYSSSSYPIRDNALAPNAFYGCNSLVSVSLPINTTTIYYRAFYNCTSLQFINKVYDEDFVTLEKISDDFTKVSADSLTGTTNYYNSNSAYTLTDNFLIKSNKLIGYLGTDSIVTIPNTVTAIGDYAFAYNLYVTEVIIPASVVTVETNAFIGCENLINITFANNSELSTIESNAFNGCIGLTTIIIPTTVTTIENNAFTNCDELISVYFTSSSPATIGTNTFSGTVALYVPEINVDAYKTAWPTYASQINKSNLPEIPVGPDPEDPEQPVVDPYTINGTTLTAYNGDDTTFVVPNGITTIGAYAFRNNNTLTSITLPSTISTIQEGAFYNCNKLEQIIFASNITLLSDKVFYNCSNLKFLTNLSWSNVSSIGDYAFYGCSSLNIVNLRIYATIIGTNVFQNCKTLSTITFMNALDNNTVPTLTFSGCTNLTTVVLPSTTITNIGSNAFSGCSNLTTITNLNTNLITTFGNYAFANCEKYVFSNKTLTLGYISSMGVGVFDGCKSLTTLNLTNSTFPSNTIPARTFANCTGLTTINLPSDLTTIENNAFEGCSGLSTFAFNNNINTIGNYTFANCTNLTNINLNNVANLGSYAFKNCYALQSITMPDTLTTLKSYTFENCLALNSLNLQYITTIEAYALKNCETLTTTTLSSNLTILNENAFDGWIGLTTITLPANLKEIKNYAFANCENLLSLDLSNVDATKLGSYIMLGCKSLTNVVLPNNLTKISQSLFYGASSLQTISSTSPNITTIETYAFFNCQNLTDIFIDFTKLTSIGNYAFYNCYNLNFGTILTLSNAGVTDLLLGSYSFTNCKKLKNVVIASKRVKYSSSNRLAPCVFQNCTELLTITLPATPITYFYASTFQNCIALTTINNLDLSKVTALDSNVFYNCQSLNFGDTLENPLQISNSAIPTLTLNASVFYNCKQLKNIEFCSQKIQYSSSSYSNYLYSTTFYGCINLEKVTLPSTNQITKFGSNIFAYCINLREIQNFDLSNVTILNNSVFYNCFNLNFGETVVLNQNLTTFGTSVFYNCKKLQNITFNGNLTTKNILPASTFYGCNNLQTVTINSTLNTIDSSAFNECSNLTTINADFSTVTSIKNTAFNKCRLLNFVGGLTLGNLSTFGKNVFYGNNSLESVTFTKLPNNTLPAYTFFNCFNLQTIVLPNNLININTFAFSGCSSLEEITLPNTLITIESYAFDGCVSLKTLTLPNSIAIVGSSAFRFCSNLTSCTLSTNESYTTISDNMFYGCISLRTITIPTNITGIGSNSFNYCSSLTTVYMLNSTPITNIKSNSFSNSYLNIIVPDAAYSQYLGTSVWATFKNMLAKTSEFEIVNGFLTKGTTLISYIGDAEEINISGTQVTLKKTGEADLTFNLTIASVGKFAFVELDNLATLKIKSTVACSTNYHYNCNNLSTIEKYE